MVLWLGLLSGWWSFATGYGRLPVGSSCRALEKLAFDLMKDSDALKKEKAVLFAAHSHPRQTGKG
jgi:hypothetical protein